MTTTEYMREYRKKNRERLNAYARQRYHDLYKDNKDHQERQAATSAEWYKENAERLSEERKEKYARQEGCFSPEKRKEYYERAKSKPDFKIKNRESTKKRSENKREMIKEIQVSLGCMNPNCQWTGEYKSCDLDFHHIDPAEKRMQVSQMGTCSLDKICEEINKCVVVCAICHRRVHAGEWNANTVMKCNVGHDGVQLLLS